MVLVSAWLTLCDLCVLGALLPGWAVATQSESAAFNRWYLDNTTPGSTGRRRRGEATGGASSHSVLRVLVLHEVTNSDGPEKVTEETERAG